MLTKTYSLNIPADPGVGSLEVYTMTHLDLLKENP